MSIVLNTIEAFPNGRSTVELFALLDVDFKDQARDAIRAELDILSHQGLIKLGRDAKWRLVARLRSPIMEPRTIGTVGSSDFPSDLLIAAPARFDVTSYAPVEEPVSVEAFAKPDPQALLRYYRAAIRSDPRGALTQNIDSYGTAHVLLSGNGQFWPSDVTEQGEIFIKLDDLPDKFREALKRRESNENALAVGWPISVATKSGVPVLRPVGLVAAEWGQAGDELVIRVTHADILVNPDWIRASARATAWRSSDLNDVFRASEGVGLTKEDFAERLGEAQASVIRGKLTGAQFVSQIDPVETGIYNSLGLFLPTESTFTTGAARDLDRIAAWPEDRIAATALGSLLGLGSMIDPPAHAPVNVGPINAEQFEAVRAAMEKPLSVVTGPPGTGKSQAIVSMAATAMLAGESVLVASKNHQALDAVEERLTDIAEDVAFVVRTLNPAREIDMSIEKVLKDILSDTGTTREIDDPFLRARLGELARRRVTAFDAINRRRVLNFDLAELGEQLALRNGATDVTPAAPTPPESSWWRRLLRLVGLTRPSPTEHAPGTDSARLSRHAIEKRIDIRRGELDALSDVDDPHVLTTEIIDLGKHVVARTLASRAVIDEQTRNWLSNLRDDLELQGGTALPREAVETTIDHRPLWLASVLGTPRRIPLHDGLFDLVIFDEASQCDIGTALPLLARARRAVVVGDDRQLAFISQIGAAQDRNLMATQGLPNQGMGRFAQGRKSLFDLAKSTPGANLVLLRNQYRSAPDIVDYISTSFYGGKLRPAADPKGLRAPKGLKPGLTWTDVPGRGEAGSFGHVNRAEVSRIASHLEKLLLEEGYEGSVGVITPFRTQVHALEEELKARLSPAAFASADLKVATVDGFQGQERDLIIFSPAVHAGSAPSAVTFVQRDPRRLNVAISRARAVSHVFGDLTYARSGKIKSLVRLAARATEPRLHQTGESVFDSEWERIVFHGLKKRGLDPKPQHEIAGRRLDFALFSGDIKLDLEVDGRRWHQDTDGNRKPDDIWRDHQLMALGWRVRRFWVDELARNLEKCLDLVQHDLA